MALPDTVNPHVSIQDLRPEQLPRILKDLEHWLENEGTEDDTLVTTDGPTNIEESVGHSVQPLAHEDDRDSEPFIAELGSSSQAPCSGCQFCESLEGSKLLVCEYFKFMLAIRKEREWTPEERDMGYRVLSLDLLSRITPLDDPTEAPIPKKAAHRYGYPKNKLTKSQKKTLKMKARTGKVKTFHSPLAMAELAAEKFTTTSASEVA